MNEKLHGIYPILCEFYGADGHLDRSAMKRQVECCIAAGAPGESVAQQTALAPGPVANGADWLILQPPQTTKPSEVELMRFFGAVMEAVDVPVGIQNFPEVHGIGLSPAAVGDLHRQHHNFTVIKGEGPVYQIRKFMDASHDNIGVFNGRGGIELPDNMRAGCAGIIPARDCADWKIRMYDVFRQGAFSELDTLYARTLAYVIFGMQSVGFALTYGKQLTARRMGISGQHEPRDLQVPADTFVLERLAAHAAFMSEFGDIADHDASSQ